MFHQGMKGLESTYLFRKCSGATSEILSDSTVAPSSEEHEERKSILVVTPVAFIYINPLSSKVMYLVGRSVYSLLP